MKIAKNYVNDVYLERAVVEKEMAVVLRCTELVKSLGWCLVAVTDVSCLRQLRRNIWMVLAFYLKFNELNE